MNLLKETMNCLLAHRKTPEDVQFVTDGVYSCSFEDFTFAAKDFYYDKGFGIVRVNAALAIVGDDWWLERVEHDGSEWWSYKTKPNREKPLSGCRTLKLIEE